MEHQLSPSVATPSSSDYRSVIRRTEGSTLMGDPITAERGTSLWRNMHAIASLLEVDGGGPDASPQHSLIDHHLMKHGWTTPLLGFSLLQPRSPSVTVTWTWFRFSSFSCSWGYETAPQRSGVVTTESVSYIRHRC